MGWALRLSNSWNSWNPQTPGNQAGSHWFANRKQAFEEAGQESGPTSVLVLLLEDVGVLQPEDGCAGGACLLGVAGLGGVLGSTRGGSSTWLEVSFFVVAAGDVRGVVFFTFAGCCLVTFVAGRGSLTRGFAFLQP